MTSSAMAPELSDGNPFSFLPATPSVFVGRWPDVNRIASDMAYGASSYACIGGRRCGKTSMLRMIEHTLNNDPHFAGRTVCLCEDPMGYEFASPEHVFGTFLRHLGDRVGLRSVPTLEPAPVPHIDLDNVSALGQTLNAVLGDASPYVTAEQFGHFVNAIFGQLEQVGGPRRLVILVDEMESFLKYAWQIELYGQMRAAIASGPAVNRLRIVLAGSKSFLTAPGYHGSPLMNMLKPIYLSSLDEPAIGDLCGKAGDLPTDTREAIWRLSGGHPFIAVYLLMNLLDNDEHQRRVTDAGDFALRFIQEETLHLETWSRTVGLVGLQVYGLFLDATGWVDKQSIVQRAADPKLNISEALNVLSYHCLLHRNKSSTQFALGGTVFRSWYHNEIARLVAELKPDVADSPSLPQFFLQLIQNGPLTAAFGSHSVAIAGDASDAIIIPGSGNTVQRAEGTGISQSANVPSPESLATPAEPADTVTSQELQMLVMRAYRETAAAIASGALNDELAIDLDYHLKKALAETKKEPCSLSTVSGHLTRALAAIDENQDVPEGLGVSISYITQILEK